MKKIKITEFGARHFDHKFGGTKILNKSKEEVEDKINTFNVLDSIEQFGHPHGIHKDVNVIEGYAPFCKLVAIKNFTNAKVGSMPITLDNYPYIRSGYSARRDNELPVFSRWLELPITTPRAEYLMFVLYDKEQIDKEAKVEYEKEIEKYKKGNPLNRTTISTPPIKPEPFDADWGVVAILGQSHSDEEKMQPATMLRNALGMEEGGSGTPLNKEEYLKSVEFWSNNIIVK